MKITEEELEHLEFLSQWLETEEKKEEGYDKANITLLKMQRNQVLFTNLSRKRNLPKLTYEVQKFVDFKKTVLNDARNEKALSFEQEIVKTIYPAVEAVKDKETEVLEKGKRADHDLLPDEIKAIFDGQREIYYKMSRCHTEAKSRNNQPPCERFPFVKELKELKAKLDENWKTYDSYVLPPVTLTAEKTENIENTGTTITDEQIGEKALVIDMASITTQNVEKTETTELKTDKTEIDAKRISANRKYISDNKAKVTALKETDPKKYKVLFDEIQKRISELQNANAGLSEALIEELKTLGFNTDKNA